MKTRAYQQIFSLLRSYRPHIILGLILSLIPAYMKVWLPYLLGEAIDQGISANAFDIFIWIASIFLGIQILSFLIQAATNFFLIHFGLNVLVDYRTQLLEKVLSYKINFFDRMTAGKISTRLTNDVNSLQELFSSALIVLVGNFVTMLGVAIAMFVLNWKLALVALSIVPLLVWLIRVFQARLRRRTGFMRKSLSNLNAYAGEALTGVVDIRGLGVRDTSREEFFNLSKKNVRRHIDMAREYTTFNPSIYLLTSLMSILVLLYGAWAFGAGGISVGEIAAFLTYANFFAWPLQEFAEKYTILQQALGAVDRLVEISEHEPEDRSGEGEFGDFQKIKFLNLSFRYASSQGLVLDQINFNVQRGQKIALIGETGAGKTTTCSLLMRFYEPTSGGIYIDDQRLQDFDIESLRRNIGWVSQDVFLFSTSLRENLRFYDPNISDEMIWSLLETIQLKKWVESLPHGLEEELNERASSISSGQRQLISLARALLPRPKILVFDEATSHVDSQTEFMLQEALENLWKSKDFSNVTAFVIAHRLSTIRLCDRILAFQNGRIIEEGSFQELMDLRGYAFLLQQKQFREAAAR